MLKRTEFTGMSSIDFRKLFLESTAPCLIVRADLAIAEANPAFERISHRPCRELAGLPLIEAFGSFPSSDDDSPLRALRAALEEVFRTGEPNSILLERGPTAAGAPEGIAHEGRCWRAMNTPIADDAGRVTHACLQAIDITELQALKSRVRSMEQTGLALAEAERQLYWRTRHLQDINRAIESERNRLLHLFDQSPGFVAITRGPDHLFELANQSFRKLVGGRDVVGKPVGEAMPELERQGYRAMLDRVYRTGKPYVGKAMRIFLSNDPQRGGRQTEMYVDFVYQPIVEADGSVSGIAIEGHDITELKRTEHELRATNERWNFVMEGSGDAFWDWNLGTNELILSCHWNDLFGYDVAEVQISRNDVIRRIHPDDIARVSENFKACVRGDTELFSCEYRILTRDNGWKWVHGRGRVGTRGENGAALRMTGTVTDISEKKRTEEQIWRQANYDTLTGLPNRSLLRDRLEQEIRQAERSGERFALCFIDLDRFKEVNDLLGHDVGDTLLKQAAMRISKNVRASDTVARLGGDEFTVILSGFHDIESVQQIARKILDALGKPFRLRNEVLHISGSIGITIYPTDGGDSESLLRNADQAMYVAKNGGRNQFSFFTRTMQKAAASRLRLIADLRDALPGGQFQVFFQPIVDMRSKRVVKAEALLRWNHPRYGMYYPGKFIHLAEETGLINQIGDWVFTQSAFWSQRWSRQLGEPFQISVNKSPVQFYAEERDLDWVEHLAALGLSRNNISVEITEGVLLNASSEVSEKLLNYRDAGMEVALDDFGTGYSSMAYLKKFHIDYLKIDQSFVRDMAQDSGSRAIAETIILMAHKLGLKVIAEGIETDEQREILCASDCDYGQGFLFSQALPPEELERLLHGDAVSA